jgi:hypothetical protein
MRYIRLVAMVSLKQGYIVEGLGKDSHAKVVRHDNEFVPAVR